MNKRIFELIQAQNGVRGLLWTEEDKQEFAELIVQECADVVQEGRWMVPPSQKQLARSIKQHFGVEK